MMYVFFLIASIVLVFGQEPDCGSKETCRDCIQQYNCVWCIDPVPNNTPKKESIHCLPSNYKSKNIICNNIVTLEANQSVSKDDEFRDGDDPIQLKPQRIKVSLRKGKPMNIHFEYMQAKNYPVDLYYILDLSNSMIKHKKKLAQLGIQLANTLHTITNDVRLGFGSFIDKVALPFTSTAPDKLVRPCIGCEAPYSFKNHLALSEKYSAFESQVENAKVSGNLDSPEGGLDAIMQAIVCKKEIGWRPQSRHLLVFSTDAEFHIAGDGKLAGVIEPNDAKCHLSGGIYNESLKFDYPSVSQINYIAKENNINIIFAIVDKEGLAPIYKELSKNIENSKYGAIKDNDDSILKLVKNNYNKIVQSVTLTHNASDDIDIKITPTCKHAIPNGCSNIHVGEKVSFNATIELRKCHANGPTKKAISIKPDGLDEALIIDLELICDCPCSSKTDPNYKNHPSECSNNGDLVCGVCKCDEGRLGRNCECDRSSGWSSDTTNCIKEGHTDIICSGLGECKCGKCDCNTRSNPDERIYGKFCECDNYSCMKGEGNLLCSGRGTCDCGNCTCKAEYTGKACECPESNSGCIAPGTDLICSGHGWCSCGNCQCNDTDQYTGKYCQECKTCPAQRCEEFRHCVECQAYQTGIYDKNECESNCTEFLTIIVDKLSEDNVGDVKKCRVPDKIGCIIIFEYVDGDKLIVRAQKEKLCAGPPDILAWILGVIGTILLAGLIMLIVWKVCTTIHDRREYAKFDNERKGLKWHRNDNPLYKGATSTFSNPAYNK